MLIAGEASGDLLAAELVSALREACVSNPQFIGAGGPRMAAAGVELAFDLTQQAIIGVPSLKNLLKYRRLFNQLLKLAIERKPDAIIGVDYGGFNLRLGHAIRQYVRNHPGRLEPENHPVCVAASLGVAAGPGESARGGLRFAPEHFSVREGVVRPARAAVARGICRTSDDRSFCLGGTSYTSP